MLHYLSHGVETDQPALLIAHGLYGSGRNWGVIAKRLSDRCRVIVVDMRNHGHSPWGASHTYADLATDLAEVIADPGGPMDVLGHSMGGKAAMMLALRYPDMVNRLIVGDISPVSYSHSQLRFIDAMRAVDLSMVTRRSEAEAQLARQGVEPALQSFFTQSLDIPAKRWRLNLDALANQMPHILAFPDVHSRFQGPTLFLSGAASDYVRPAYRPGIKRLFPQARFAKIPAAGHWLHTEQPRAFEAAVRVFLDT
ncbi:MAG: alpha/beta fold hydrolase [Rhodobacteraceae bacterium]|nr:alpha/beta fold hydrolase [Paracoccaceae bacterium]